MGQSSLWNREVIKDIQEKARTGRYGLRGFGTNRSLPGLDDLTILPAQLTGPTAVDKYREQVNTRVVVGEYLPRPLVLETPVFIPAMSFGAVSKEGKTAFAAAVSSVGTATNSGEGGALPEEWEQCAAGGGKMVVQWSTGRFGVNRDYLLQADAIEVKIGQGAKPGMGGHLMAEKISPEISKIRGIPQGTDALSPCRHLDVQGVDDLATQVEMLREVTRGEIPIILKLGPADVYHDVCRAVELGVDAIALDGAQGGTGCSPDIVIEHTGVPTLGMFAPATRALEDTGARKKGVKLLMMGGIRHGADVYKALALGADAVGMATAAMVAMGCTGCQQCHTGRCAQGIASQNQEATLNWEQAASDLTRFLKATTQEVSVLTALSGHHGIEELGCEDLMALSLDAAAITGLPLVGYGQALPMWQAMEKAPAGNGRRPWVV